MKPIRCHREGTTTTLIFGDGSTSKVDHGTEEAAIAYTKTLDIAEKPGRKPTRKAKPKKPAKKR